MSQHKQRINPIQVLGNVLVFVLLTMYGYNATAEPPSDSLNWTLYWAFMLHLGLVAEKLYRKHRKQKAVWKYVNQTYRQYPRELADTPETPIDFRLASPTLNDGVKMLRLQDIYEIDLASGRQAFLTQVDSTRSLFGNADAQMGDYTLSYLVLAVKVGTPTPHIFIDGRAQNRFGRRTTDLWSLTKRLSRQEKIQDLEGDFSEYFDVYSPDKKYLSALTIVTPDVMLALRDEGHSFDYELHDGVLYVIHETQLNSVEDFKALIIAAQSCLSELIPQIAKHKYGDAGKVLRIQTARLNLWAFIYSSKIVGVYMAKVIGALVAGVLFGGFLHGFD